MKCLGCGGEIAKVYHQVGRGEWKVGERVPLEVLRRWGPESDKGRVSDPIREVLPVKHGRNVSDRWERIWVGERRHYGPRETPFCRLRCAEQFAYAAARAGYRLKGVDLD